MKVMQCKFMKMEKIQYTSTLNSSPAHTLLLQSPHHCGQEPAPLAKHTTPIITDTHYCGNMNTFMPPSAIFHLFFSLAIADT